MKLVINYISTRLKPFQFLILAGLFVLLIHSPATEIGIWIKNILFLWFSFMTFRFLDDCGSAYFDRDLHPTRQYAQARNKKMFLAITTFVVLGYVVILFIIQWGFLKELLFFIVLLALLYWLFFKQKNTILVLPLLKYPVLLSTLVLVPSDYIPQLLASFFIILMYDLAENVHTWTAKFGVLIAAELIGGFLLFGTLSLVYAILLTLIPLLFTVIFKTQKTNEPVIRNPKLNLRFGQYLHGLLIFYYPIMYFVFTQIITL